MSKYLDAHVQDRAIDVDVRFDPSLLERVELADGKDCIEKINAELAMTQITFEPGSSDLELSALSTISNIATILRSCSHVPIEVGGYTDSQGRETMNLQLSAIRAEAVILALVKENTAVRNLVARGYGEANPIADNETEAGREKNRRIEFKLVVRDFYEGPQ